MSDAQVDLAVTVGKIRMRNPIATASGCSGYGEELAAFYDPGLLGAIVTKSITLEPRPGHPPPRLVETKTMRPSGRKRGAKSSCDPAVSLRRPVPSGRHP